MASGVKDIFLDAQVYYPVTVERVCSAHTDLEGGTAMVAAFRTRVV
jgi:hypothetical protein